MKKIILFSFLLFSTTFSFAQRRGSIINIDGSISVARVNDYIENCFHRQYKDNWCWAACVQMVLDYYGVSVSQSRIAERVYGGNYDITANKYDIISTLNGWYINGNTVRASYERYKNAKTLIDAVANGKPLIIGLDERYSSTGHAYVLTHIFFTRDYSGSMTPIRVVVINPANSYDLEESLDWSDFYKRINTIITLTKS